LATSKNEGLIMSDITSANSVLMLTVFPLFPIPQQLQGFAAEDVFDTDPLESAETLMGVDGRLSAGFVFVPVMQNYALQADSPSVFIFDTWWTSQQIAKTIFFGDMTVLLTSLGKKWAMTNGVLSSYKPLPDGKKVLQPQRFRITWESALPAVA
jgi:hypothetical protein